MGQTRMFRDRVVSMEQTLEGGEKHLPLLKALCAEALPELVFREHSLDHERDMFVMDFDTPDGGRRRISWTRMVLFDAERIPTLTADPAAALRTKIVEHIRSQAARPEILVTFRHLEEGWVDTPEPRRDGSRRRRRGGRAGARGQEKGGPDRRPGGGGQSQRDRERNRERRPGGGPSGGGQQPAARPERTAPRAAAAAAAPSPGRGGGAGPRVRGRTGRSGRKAPAPPASPRRPWPRRAGRRPGRLASGAGGAEAVNFEFTEDQKRIRDAVRAFAESEIAPHVARWEKEERFPREVLRRLGAMGVMGMMVPEAYGGAGADALSYVLAVEELARVCASTAVIVSVNNSVACYPIWKFGTEEQKTTILKPLASGTALGAYALTEPQSGSDAANQKTRAVRDGDGYVLNGAKAWITNAGEADWYVVMAMTDAAAGTRGITAFLVSAADEGLRIGAPEDKMGLRSSKTAAIFFEDVQHSGRRGASAPRARGSRSR